MHYFLLFWVKRDCFVMKLKLKYYYFFFPFLWEWEIRKFVMTI